MVCISFILRVEVHQERDVRTKMGWLMERGNDKEKGKVAERNLLLPSLQNPTLGIFIMGGHQAAPLCMLSTCMGSAGGNCLIAWFLWD
jgi:hypothetical protein